MGQGSGSGDGGGGRSAAPRGAPVVEETVEAPAEAEPSRGSRTNGSRSSNGQNGQKPHPTDTKLWKEVQQRRVPSDIAAETSLLGAMFLSASARDVATSRLSADDFYGPSNGHIFEAIERLHLDGHPVDEITVADALGGLLEDVHVDTETGRATGRSALTALIAYTPSTSSAPRYAEIIERTARQRQVIGWADRLQERAFQGTEWHDELGRVLEIGNRNGVVFSPSTIEFVDLGPILAGDVEAERPFWLSRSDGRSLLYPGRVHDLHAPPSVGKTWLALLAVMHVLAAGGNALILDFEDTAHNALSRLLAIGGDPTLLGDPNRFRYSNPAGAYGLAERAHLHKVLGELEPDLVILDGVAASLARCGYDENSNTEVSQWSETLVKPIAATGAAVLMLDHVPKSTENRSRGARGAGAKLAMIDGASYELRISRAYSRHRAGLVRVIIAKDRHGHVGGIGEVAADLHVKPYDGGARVELVLDAPSTDAGHRLTGLMEILSKRLEGASGPMTKTIIFAGLQTDKRHLERALADLMADGYVVPTTTGKGSTVTYRTERAYREPDEDEETEAGREPEPDEGTDPGRPEQPTQGALDAWF